MRGADDGMWEWNLRTGSVYFSARWKSMLGYADHELGDRMEEWRARLHPQDIDRVVGELDTHLQGKSARFEPDTSPARTERKFAGNFRIWRS